MHRSGKDNTVWKNLIIIQLLRTLCPNIPKTATTQALVVPI